jgi:predicted amidohydrolase YtcJ
LPDGDVTIDMVLTALERAQRLYPRPDPRPKITHCSLVNEDLLVRLKAVGAIPAPFTSLCDDHGHILHIDRGTQKTRLSP